MRFIRTETFILVVYLFASFMTHGSEFEQDPHKSQVLQQIENIKKLDRDHRERKHVVILGAGIAGLTAACELSSLGHTVEIIEASNRYGGRIWTHYFKSSDQYGELGAMRIPASHDYTHHYIKVAGLQNNLRPFITAHQNPNCFYQFRGHPPIRMRESALFIEKEYRLPAYEQHILTSDFSPKILGTHLWNAVDSLHSKGRKNQEEWSGLLGGTLLNDRAQNLEKLSLGEFLEQKLGGNQEVKELIGATTGLELWWDKAVTMFLREEITGTSNGLKEIRGGFSILPNSLVELLKEKNVKFRLETEVTSIEVPSDPHQKITLKTRPTTVQSETGYSVSTKEKIIPEKADFVLCTIPFGVMRTMELKGLSSEKMTTIRNLTYASSTKVLLHFEDRFWERGSDQEHILGGASMSDGITRCTYYPSDHAESKSLVPSEEDEPTGVFTVSKPLEIRRNIKAPLGPNPIPGVLLGSYNWGQDAIRLGTFTSEERTEIVLTELEKFHPQIRKYLNQKEPGKSIFWDAYPWTRGAFCGMRPNDMLRYHYASKKSEGNLYFAGEHCSLDPGWIQGAIKSALDAVEKIVEAKSI